MYFSKLCRCDLPASVGAGIIHVQAMALDAVATARFRVAAKAVKVPVVVQSSAMACPGTQGPLGCSEAT